MLCKNARILEPTGMLESQDKHRCLSCGKVIKAWVLGRMGIRHDVRVKQPQLSGGIWGCSRAKWGLLGDGQGALEEIGMETKEENSQVGNHQYWLAGCKFGRVSETLVSGVVLRGEHNLIAYILKKCLGCCKLQHFCRKCAKCAKTRISLEFMHGRLPNFMGMSWEQLWSCW